MKPSFEIANKEGMDSASNLSIEEYREADNQQPQNKKKVRFSLEVSEPNDGRTPESELHELYQPLTAYFATSEGIILHNFLIKDPEVKRLLVWFLKGKEYARKLSQQPSNVSELFRAILKSIPYYKLAVLTSAQAIAITEMLKPYADCTDDFLFKLAQYTSTGDIKLSDYHIGYFITEDSLNYSGTINSPTELIQYYQQNRNIYIDCIDRYFDKLVEELPRDKLLIELTQTDFSRSIAERGNTYALYRYFKLLNTFSQPELNVGLTFKDKDRKTISDYLLAERYKEGLAYEYVLISYVDILRKVSPLVRPTILSCDKDFTLVNRIMYESKGDPKILCDYLVVFGNDKKLISRGYHEPVSQQLVFEYIKNMADSPNKHKLIDLALSVDSALHAFIVHIRDGHIGSFLMAPMFQNLHPYIWALSELKQPAEQQNQGFISKTMNFFLPAPLNTTKIDNSEFDYGM